MKSGSWQMALRLLILAIACIANCQSALAWPSLIDDRYRKLDPALYARYDEARDLIDRYNGETAFLELGGDRLRYVLLKNPHFAPAYMQLARLLILRDDTEGGSGYLAAEQAIEKAVEIEPGYADAWVQKGYIDAHLGRHDQARAEFDKAKTLASLDPWLDINIAEDDLMTGSDDDAREALDRISARGTDSSKANHAICEMYIKYFEKRNDLKKIDLWHRKEIALDPNDAWPRGNYARFLVWYVGDFEAGEKQARESLALMDYENGEEWLAAALYAEWANAPEGRRPSEKLEEARKLDPDVASMADEFSLHPPTRALAEPLRKAIIPQRKPDVL